MFLKHLMNTEKETMCFSIYILDIYIIIYYILYIYIYIYKLCLLKLNKTMKKKYHNLEFV